jgi:hypothetical protein
VIGEGWELLDGRFDGEAEEAAEEGRRQTSVGRSGEGLRWGGVGEHR